MEESRFRKYLFNEGTLVLALVGVISSFIFWVSNPQQELQLKFAKLEGKVESSENNIARLENKLDELNKNMTDLIQEVASLKGSLTASK